MEIRVCFKKEYPKDKGLIELMTEYNCRVIDKTLLISKAIGVYDFSRLRKLINKKYVIENIIVDSK